MPTVTVAAPSRLHFGLFALGDSPCAYGGVGAMVDEPGLHLKIADADTFSTSGQLADRVEAFTLRISDNFGWSSPPQVAIAVTSAPGQHTGLGVGTQLGLAVAAGLDAWASGAVRPASQLAHAAGRGRRSAVGAHGFEHGGLIVDGGHGDGDAIGRLDAHVTMPEAWRFVLITPPLEPGPSGASESDAFGRLPPIPPEATAQLRRLATEALAPAAEAADFDPFAETLGRYGQLAGGLFAAVQGGPFASPQIERLVDWLGDQGFAGAGQSSWGPTVFAATASSAEADRLESAIRHNREYRDAQVTTTACSRHGAVIDIVH